MAFTLNVTAGRRLALLKEIVSSARVPETGALRMDIQVLNGQLVDAFKMKGVVTRYCPITPRMLEAFWRAEEKSSNWTEEYVYLTLPDVEKAIEERLGTTPLGRRS